MPEKPEKITLDQLPDMLHKGVHDLRDVIRDIKKQAEETLTPEQAAAFFDHVVNGLTEKELQKRASLTQDFRTALEKMLTLASHANLASSPRSHEFIDLDEIREFSAESDIRFPDHLVFPDQTDPAKMTNLDLRQIYLDKIQNNAGYLNKRVTEVLKAYLIHIGLLTEEKEAQE